MSDFESRYSYILDYPEFSMEKILRKHEFWVVLDAATGEGEMKVPEWIFRVDTAYQYVIHVYAPDSPFANCKDLKVRKQKALEKFVEVGQWDAILANSNPMIGDMVTRIFREINDFNYELLMSTKEAIETLMEVVRKPLDSRMTDEKERNAIKSKRECYDDSKYLLGEIRKMQKEIEESNEDVAEILNKSVFKAGMAEKLALKANK